MRTTPLEDGGWIRRDSTEVLKERLADPKTVAQLVQLLDRLDAVDQALSLAEIVLRDGPAITAMVADTLDEVYREAGVPGLELQQRTRTALELAGKLTQPSTAQSLSRLMDQLQVLEHSLEGLRLIVESGPGVVAGLADSLDEFCRQAGMSSVDLDQRIQKGLQLLGKLTQPATLEALAGLVAQAHVLDQSTGLLAEILERGPGVAAAVADSVDELYRDALRSGIDPHARLKACLEIARKATEPRLLRTVRDLLEHGEAIERLSLGAVQLAEQGPSVVAAVTDILDEWCRAAGKAGVNIELLRRRAAMLGAQLLRLVGSDEFGALLQSGILEPKTLGVLGSAGEALASSRSAGSERLGRLGLVRAMGDPDVQRALNFFVSFAKRFGRSLSVN